MKRCGGWPAEALAPGQDRSRLPGGFCSPCFWASMFRTVQWAGAGISSTPRVLRNKPLEWGEAPHQHSYSTGVTVWPCGLALRERPVGPLDLGCPAPMYLLMAQRPKQGPEWPGGPMLS